MKNILMKIALNSKALKMVYLLGLLLLPQYAFADGGGPLLLFVSLFAFTVGQVWILFSETLYLNLFFKEMKFGSSLWTVFIMNIISTVIGGVLFPIAICLIVIPLAYVASLLFDTQVISDFLAALGTWGDGENSPYPNVAIGMTVFWFICEYFISVFIEYKVLCKRLAKLNIQVERCALIKHCYLLNLLSYTGLVIIVYFMWVQ